MTRQNRYPQKTKTERTEKVGLKNRLLPRTSNQEFYLSMLRESTITLCSGPAGCGKTWLVTGVALEKLIKGEVDKIVITKPILEAGEEELGFLPGMVEDKILPHFQSILDCFEDHIGPTMLKRYLDNGTIKFLPVAYARGRDLRDSFILIDEAQNLTRKGIKLMMTRISENSIMAINGDTDQIDLPRESDSGLAWAINALVGKNSEIAVTEMTLRDVQRHPIITTILECLR